MSFGRKIRPSVDRELSLAANAVSSESAFSHLERAHVIGQNSTHEHVRVHWAMLCWGVKQRDRREVLGQLFRLCGALTKTAIGLVPSGNTGGSNVSPFQKMPVPADLQELIYRARQS